MNRDGLDVLEMLERRGRARRLRQATEAAAVTGVAGCMAATAAAGALGVQGGYRGAAMGMAATPLAMGLIVATWGAVRRRVRPAAPVAAVLIAGGLLGLGVLLVGGERSFDRQRNLADDVDRVTMTAAMVAAALLAGAVPVLARRVDVAGTGRLLDERGGFAERLGTAAAVAGRAAEDPAAAMVCRQGAAILRGGQADRVSLWRRTPATPAALAVVALVWVTTLLLPVIEPPKWGAGADLAALSGEEKAELIRKIQAAAMAARSPSVDLRLAALPSAVRAGDGEAVAAMLEELRRAGVDVREALGAELAAAVGERGGEAGGTPSRHRQGSERQGAEPAAVGGGGPVAWIGPASPEAAAGAEQPTAGRMMPFDQAWREAGIRAAASLEAGVIPSRHRQLVRDYFAAGQAERAR